MKRAKEILAKVAEEEAGMTNQVEEVYRIGKYEERKEKTYESALCDAYGSGICARKDW